MSRIIPKLNLNKTPQQVDSNSLIFAKNIKLGKDGSIVGDDGLTNFYLSLNGYKIVGIIPYNTKFYILQYKESESKSRILELNESNYSTRLIDSAWHWSGGKITGNCVVNLNGDIILNIAEYDANVDVPLKSINLSTATNNDDESIYTQIPNAPILNLKYVGKYNQTIPNGVYQFFVRFEIAKDFYTNWMPCSREIFAGHKTKINKSIVGSVDYINIKKDSEESFYFDVDIIESDEKDKFSKFQLGFILSHDDNTVARIWKTFDINTKRIYFNYSTLDIIETDIINFTNFAFGLYNVKNIANFKNKQYIANYKETDFNPNLQSIADNINVQLITTDNTSAETYSFNIAEDGINYDEINQNPINNIVWGLIQNVINAYKNKAKSEGDSTSITKVINGISVDISTYEDTGVQTISDFSVFDLIDNQYAVYFTNDYNLHPIYGPSGKWISFNNPAFDVDTDIVTNIVRNSDYTLVNDSDVSTEQNKYYIYFGRKINSEDGNWETFMLELTLDCFARPSNIMVANDFTSLVPFQEYDFYIHFVKANGEITNGYKLSNGIRINDYNNEDIISAINDGGKILSPKFTMNDVNIPNEYKYYFYSIIHTKNKIFEIFNLETDSRYNGAGSGNDSPNYYGDSIELDTSLFALDTFNVIVTQSNTFTIDNDIKAYYRPSYDTQNYRSFGDEGKVLLEISGGTHEKIFGLLNYEYDSEDAQLIKCTPIIDSTKAIYGDDILEVQQMNLLGFIVNVRKPINRMPGDNSLFRYISDGNIYEKIINTGDINNTISLNPVGNGHFGYYYQFVNSNEAMIYSNYNFNYLALSEGIKVKEKLSGSYLVEYLNSQELSEVYSLPSMYKDYLRKTYSKYQNYTKSEFDNTIRSSELNADEGRTYIFKFKSTDYYNVPTNKGIITNLVSIGDVILVHTNDSLFKFSGSNSLMSNGGEDIQTTETDVFDTGISEMFGSDKGYGGLQDNRCMIATQEGYFWYDHHSNMIYAYRGEGKINILSDVIDKLLKLGTIDFVDFANDYYNDRLIINITFANTVNPVITFITISYNLKINSFISLHDYNYNYSFSTKTKCYFVNSSNDKLYRITSGTKSFDDLGANDNLYPQEINNNVYKSFIDVIYKENYEVIKTVNSINWICSKVNAFSDTSIINLAEEVLDRTYAGDKLRIYTDSCDTGDIDISAPRSNDEDFSHEDENHDGSALIPTNNTNYTNEYYTKPRYNLGKWYLNYFRNILNTNNKNDSDNKSLIYGKYVVARFVFDRTKNFKFENMSLNLSNNYNV